MTTSRSDELGAAAEQGRACALSAHCQRDMRRFAAGYPELFPAKPFDDGLFAMLSLANGFGSPQSTAEQLRVVTRLSLWVFAADWQIDYVATSREEVHSIVRECLSGSPDSDSPLARCLAAIRDDLAGVPEFRSAEPVWRRQLERFLTGMVTEWEWRAARAERLPTLDQYLENSDSTAASFVNISHWIFTRLPGMLDHLDELMAVSANVQRVLRLLNDLAGYERDLAWRDLNALLLDTTRADVDRRLKVLTDNCRETIRPLKDTCPEAAVYLERQIGFSTGFYGAADYWGQL